MRPAHSFDSQSLRLVFELKKVLSQIIGNFKSAGEKDRRVLEFAVHEFYIHSTKIKYVEVYQGLS